MKKTLPLLIALLFSMPLMAQNKAADKEALPKVYNESIDAMAQIDKAIEQAQAEHKFVLCQVGGNWCPWCLRFADFAEKDSVIAPIIKDNYVWIHVNTSKANKNLEAMKRLDNPGRFGYPVFVILDADGKRIHTQNSAYLEEGKGYSQKKVSEFLLNWTEKAINQLK
ncbi:MAG: thioredoxin family protein [Bacteroidales bacterium]|nr:thioredoxin family protein [Bacteroidales bacterium]